MLEARKSRIFEAIFAVYNRNLLRRRFHSFKVQGLDFLLDKNDKLPLIIYCNHSSWWDGLIAFEISRLARLDSFVMMEEKHLKRLFLFRKLGAFSVERDKPREAIKSLNYAAGLLMENSKRALWIFPQGEILPNDLRPLKFYNGIAKIIEKLRICNTVSLSMRYEFLGEYKPDVFVKIDEPQKIIVDHYPTSKVLTEMLSHKTTSNLDALRADVVNGSANSYQLVF